MSVLKPRRHPEQAPLLTACTTSAPPVIDEAQLTRPTAMSTRYPAPLLAIGSRAQAAIDELRAADEIPTYPIAQADWSARIAADFGAVNSALIWLAQNTRRALNDAAWAEYYAAVGLHEACLSVEVEVGGWRKEVAATTLAAALTQGAEVAAR